MVPLSVLPQFMPDFADLRHALKFKIGTPWRELESHAIEITLAHTRGDKSVAARLLGCHLAQYIVTWIEKQGEGRTGTGGLVSGRFAHSFHKQ
jgi:hypothetical protein